MACKYVMILGRSILDEHGLKDWELSVEPIKHRGYVYDISGECCHWDKRIYLDWQLLSQYSLVQIRDVILHEIAHALAGKTKPPHNRRWQNTARKIGVPEEDIGWGIECDAAGSKAEVLSEKH